MQNGRETEMAKLAEQLAKHLSALVALCAKHSKRITKKLSSYGSSNSRIVPKLPLASSKQLFTMVSNKTKPLLHRKKISEGKGGRAEEDFGDGGLWQREILMGEKCQPLDFSGVIYYDGDGKRLSELPPRSPRASPMPSFAFTVLSSEKVGT